MPIPTATSYYMDGTEALSSTSQLEADQRALHLAIEYSMLGLTNDDDTSNTFDELRVKKSVNMTECVAVPSSEHVAEIVGRQGCKIKALRAKTNTYIKTPVRGEDPVFVITGRKEDVAVAKQEILSAANHFSQIRAQRKNSTLNSGPSSPTGGPGQTTIQVRVPYRVVGLVVGPKGATIKRIQQATNTYIVTPSRDKEPIFEVTGSLENVESARKEIETHIVLRTGGLLDDDVFQGSADALNSFNGFQTGHIYANGVSRNGRDLHRALSTDSFYLNSSKITDYNALTSPFSTSSNGTSNGYFFNHDLIPSPTDDLIIPNVSSSGFSSSPPPPSPSIWGSDTKSDNSAFSTTNGGMNGVGSIGSGRPTTPHTTARRLASEPLLPVLPPSTTTLGSFSRFTTSTTAPIGTLSNSTNTLTTTTSLNGEIPKVNGIIGSRSPTNGDSSNNNNNVASKKKDCMVCCGSEVVAALVPCGHNFFCMECATKLKSDDSHCPVCQEQVTQVLRIIS